MEATARTFPVPEGFTAGASTSGGNYCTQLQFGCETPRLGFGVTQNETSTPMSIQEMCKFLKKSVDLWPTKGPYAVDFQLREPDGCVYEGEWKSFYINVFVADNPQPLEIIVGVLGGDSP
ncbi:MAG: hypothetical protein ACSLFB_09705 [Acidimicrobiales bacterium]